MHAGAVGMKCPMLLGLKGMYRMVRKFEVITTNMNKNKEKMLVMCMRKYVISFHLVEHSPNLICVLYFWCCSLTSFEQFNCYMSVWHT